MHPVREVTVDIERQGCVADGEVELNLRQEDRDENRLISHFLKLFTDLLLL